MLKKATKEDLQLFGLAFVMTTLIIIVMSSLFSAAYASELTVDTESEEYIVYESGLVGHEIPIVEKLLSFYPNGVLKLNKGICVVVRDALDATTHNIDRAQEYKSKRRR